MTRQLRQGVVARKPRVKLHGEVECDEVYVLVAHSIQFLGLSKDTKRPSAALISHS
uniref:Transposase n=2 Tax=Candidatus Kentrum eta TaxID=2126337 RepID=A0A450W7J0_9GAMM|nr:MAG: hypothetical protein BECKH772B_GA0070898_103884 [Candidatus Kentron sp. H]VFK13020.1 MAG: hypothetical protein BECKH772C_GA0070978_110551 [Candidatus Kentron sp. H]